MERLMTDFLTGETFGMIKAGLKKLNTWVTAGAVMGLLLMLSIAPKFTVMLVLLIGLSLFLTHHLKKFTKT